jgi:hypothetical protein
MQVRPDTSLTPLLDQREHPLVGSVPNENMPADALAECCFRERRLIRLWYFPDSFVD